MARIGRKTAWENTHLQISVPWMRAQTKRSEREEKRRGAGNKRDEMIAIRIRVPNFNSVGILRPQPI